MEYEPCGSMSVVIGSLNCIDFVVAHVEYDNNRNCEKDRPASKWTTSNTRNPYGPTEYEYLKVHTKSICKYVYLSLYIYTHTCEHILLVYPRPRRTMTPPFRTAALKAEVLGVSASSENCGIGLATGASCMHKELEDRIWNIRSKREI